MSKATLVFKEDKKFFDMLDTNIKRGNEVTIRFRDEKPNENSKLWSRLRKTKNWNMVQEELTKVEKKQTTPISSIISNSMESRLTGGEIFLIAWIATLLTGLFAYAIYKGRRIRLVLKGKQRKPQGEDEGEVELVIE